MRYLLTILLAAPANAHVGHLGEVAGHDHWTLGAGLGVIGAAAVAGWLKSRGKKAEPEPEAAEPAPEEQPA